MQKLIVLSLLALLAGPAVAAQCSTDITTSDQLTFSKQIIIVDQRCPTFTVNLIHPADAHGMFGHLHNLVVSKTSDVAGIAQDAMGTGRSDNYLKHNDARVIAHTDVVGAGETSSLTINTNKLAPDEHYSFFCSVPGHVGTMFGEVILQTPARTEKRAD
ncbi:azurin [Pseudomonas tolaasii]|nr:azurin [Pseudomonas tolaasii]ARB25892.1 azurin [Pseudomonas tolaasii]PKA78356.1 azurin [Pseudomonas tolaasii NCPPB 2192]